MSRFTFLDRSGLSLDTVWFWAKKLVSDLENQRVFGVATTAEKLSEERSFTWTGDVTGGPLEFDGSADVSTALTLIAVQPAVHTWNAPQTFTVAPVFTDAAGSRTALGLGTAAVQNIGTSGATVPLLNTANTWAAVQAFGANITVTGTVTATSTIAVVPPINTVARLSLTATGTGPSDLRMGSAPGVNRFVSSFSTGQLRWRYGTNATAEGGANSGSDYVFDNFDDASTALNTGFEITRSTGLFNLKSGLVLTKPLTVATLPAAAAGFEGLRAWVGDATAALTAGIGTVVAGGGANKVPVVCDGTNWRIG